MILDKIVRSERKRIRKRIRKEKRELLRFCLKFIKKERLFDVTVGYGSWPAGSYSFPAIKSTLNPIDVLGIVRYFERAGFNVYHNVQGNTITIRRPSCLG